VADTGNRNLRASYKTAKRSQRAMAGSKTTWRRVPEGIILQSEKCSNCGKTAKEIKKIEKEIINLTISNSVKIINLQIDIKLVC